MTGAAGKERRSLRNASGETERDGRRGRARRLFKPLDRSYWPDHIRRPYLRLLLASIVAPAPAAFASTVFAWWIYQSEGPETAMSGAIGIGVYVLIGLYIITIVGGAVMIPYLWSTRRRSFWPWVFGGAVAGAAAAAIGLVVAERAFSLVPVIVLATLGAAAFLTMRWVAGIRSRFR